MPGLSAGKSNWTRLLLILLIVAGLITATFHFGDLRNFTDLMRSAKPGWLIVAFALQLSTYVCVAFGWSLVLSAGGSPLPTARLIPLVVSKLFADQAVPAAGMSGNVLMINRLIASGVPRGNAAAALIVSMVGFYAAYALFALIALALLWSRAHATPLLAATISIFLGVAFAIPALALWLRHRGADPLPSWLMRIGLVRRLFETMGAAPAGLIKNAGLMAQVGVLNGLVFLADAATLATCFLALGHPEPVAVAYIAFIMASIAVTLAPLPLGLGAFEAVSIATLGLLGVPFEPALSATLLLRGLTLWLPLLPGFILIRHSAVNRFGKPDER
ncbi:MAG TPA: lysylphosphatidylglycerol synthase transmembrane domain-containing protein [Pseudorhodoplanes sp.]|nr:lysylphosphatidylglycerol synthase transmembrane domain-containing protein [Pseudorhodoplanes sp.]